MSSGKGKYGDLIRKAREPESQQTSKPDLQSQTFTTQNLEHLPESQQTSKPELEEDKASKLVNHQTGKPVNQIPGKPDELNSNEVSNQTARQPDNQITSKPDEKMVNLCVKVPASKRRYWAAQAKLQGITMTEVMVNALEATFGHPSK